MLSHHSSIVSALRRLGRVGLLGLLLASPTPAHAQGCLTPSFAPATNFGAGDGPRAVAVGDFNLDGNADIAVANANSNNVTVQLGDGLGSFGTATNFAAGTRLRDVQRGDFNLDGKPDLVTVNNASNNVSVLLGNGTGGFGAATNFGVGSNPFSVAVGDFNQDGKPDLAVTNDISATVSILLGDGSGSFGVATSFAVGRSPHSVKVGDFDTDGKLDLVVANSNDNTVSLLRGSGTGSFGAATNFVVGTFPVSLVVGDFNADGNLDIATANEVSDDVSVLLGNGAGSFAAATQFTAGDAPFSIAAGDFNTDGKLDLAVANRRSNDVSVLLGNGSGGFGAASNIGVGSQPRSVVVGDFNLDGKADLAVANELSNNVSVLLNSCTANTAPTASCKNVTVAAGASCTATASINDGSSDPDAGDAITLSQSPAGPYSLGGTLVTLTVTDSHNASSTCTGTVTVRDTIPPPLSCPGPVTAECAGASTPVTFATPLSGADNCGMSQSTGCTPPAGTGFGLGSTIVSCGATDTRNTSNCAFNVNIVDTIAPSLTCPSAQSAEATSATGASVNFPAPTASDACTPPAVSCDVASGATFPLGTSTVHCTASDGFNSNSCSFSVTVRDTTPPTITCPAPVTVISGQAVSLGTPTVSDLVDGNPRVSNNAPATYALGSTVVTWTARDAAGNAAPCTQTVTVQPVPFTNLSAKLEVERGRTPATGSLEYTMTFTLGAGNNGIAPATEPVTVQIGGLTFTIPAGSFRVDNKGKFKFEGLLSGVPVEAKLTPLGGNRYELKFEAERLNVSGITNPVATKVLIGNDSGAATVTAKFE